MSFARILRSSALMGGAQIIVLAAAFVRAKAIALILGASGVGLIGIFNAFIIRGLGPRYVRSEIDRRRPG